MKAHQLGQLLDGLAKPRLADAEELRLVAEEGIEEQRPGPGNHLVHVPDDEQRADLASFSCLPGDLHGELDDLLERVPAGRRARHALADKPEGAARSVSGRKLQTLFNVCGPPRHSRGRGLRSVAGCTVRWRVSRAIRRSGGSPAGGSGRNGRTAESEAP